MKVLPFFVLLTGLLSSLQATDTVQLKEWFFTDRNHQENVDSPATWHGSNGESWLIVTAKNSHRLLVHDALNGALIKTIGGEGTLSGQFNRPNGIWVKDDLVFVVERDNRRVQVMHLPDFSALGSFGENELFNPYGISVIDGAEAGVYHVYVTDNYETVEGEKPLPAELNHRVHIYEIEAEGSREDTLDSDWLASFGDTSGDGMLNIVESIYADPVHQRLLIADEEMSEAGQVIKVYDLEGKFTGQVLGKGLFKNQTEGIALWPTGRDSGYWIFADQGKQENYFHVFDRISLKFLGSFSGENTLNTDGVWLDTTSSKRHPKGLFYAIHNDGNVAAFSLAEIAKALNLKCE